jgi:hypothetical protein
MSVNAWHLTSELWLVEHLKRYPVATEICKSTYCRQVTGHCWVENCQQISEEMHVASNSCQIRCECYCFVFGRPTRCWTWTVPYVREMGNFNSSCCRWISWTPFVGAPCQCLVHVCVIPLQQPLITFYALRATHNNFLQNVEMCCFYWKSEWTMYVSLVIYIYWLQKCIRKSVKVYLHECAHFSLLVSIKYQHWPPPHPHKPYHANCHVIYLTGGGRIMWKTATWETEKKMLEFN